MTTFQSREAVRDELVTVFTSNGNWQNVYGYFPSADELVGKTPVLVIRGRGTQQDMAGLNTNPAVYRLRLSSYVLAYSESDNWTSANAEDKLDELDKVLRQVIRNNAGNGALSNCDHVAFDAGFSDVDDVIIEGLPYIVESRNVLAYLRKGSV